MQRQQRDLLAVTSAPFLPLWTGIEAVSAGLEGDDVVATRAAVHEEPLSGQEFLMFAALEERDDIASFAERLGLLGIHDLMGLDPPVSWHRPLWQRALTGSADARREPLTDWRRQAGLLRLGVGLLGLHQQMDDSARIRSVFDPEADELDVDEDWVAISIFSGAIQAGLMPSHRDGGLRFRARNWVAAYSEEAGRNVAPVLPRLQPMRESIGEALEGLLGPWLSEVHPSIWADREALVAGFSQPRQMLGILWLQLANAALAEVELKRCAWKRCPGPPDRPRVFLWKQGKPGAAHRRSATYCDPRCQHAAAVAESRKRGRE